MKILQKLVPFTIFMLLLTNKSMADVKVVASIHPIHSLVSKIMDGIGKPILILDRTASPHRFSLTPKNAEQIEEADVIFWFGPYIETFLTKPINNLNNKKKNILLSEIPNLIKYRIRSGDGFEQHDHDKHKEHTDHRDGYEDHKEHRDGHEDHKEHKLHINEIDQHVWLDPKNAKIILDEIKDTLSKIDPTNSKTYERNNIKAKEDIDNLINITQSKLKNLDKKGFIYFHDAYQYFEKRFDLTAAGSVTVNTDVMPGVKRLKQLKKIINKPNVKCIFSEPQFESKIINAIVEGTGKKVVILDPLGYNIEPGKNLYNQLIINMRESYIRCFE